MSKGPFDLNGATKYEQRVADSVARGFAGEALVRYQKLLNSTFESDGPGWNKPLPDYVPVSLPDDHDDD
ncbi:MAG: hypothetical protein M5R36_25110 [Deltaproteobacteria bacterium]|nr:hypothetical protein [Deltaproteobacteria bacterium]